jgi:hypothetical protein
MGWFYQLVTYRTSDNDLSSSCEDSVVSLLDTRNGRLTCGLEGSSSRPTSLAIASTSHVYALLSQPPVASTFPSAENDRQSRSVDNGGVN